MGVFVFFHNFILKDDVHLIAGRQMSVKRCYYNYPRPLLKSVNGLLYRLHPPLVGVWLTDGGAYYKVQQVILVTAHRWSEVKEVLATGKKCVTSSGYSK